MSVVVLPHRFGVEISKNRGHFYGTELPWVGAFTENRGSGYRNPVQILGGKVGKSRIFRILGVGVV